MSQRNEILNLLEDYWDQSLASAMVREQLATKITELANSTGDASQKAVKQNSGADAPRNLMPDNNVSGVFESEMKKRNETLNAEYVLPPEADVKSPRKNPANRKPGTKPIKKMTNKVKKDTSTPTKSEGMIKGSIPKQVVTKKEPKKLFDDVTKSTQKQSN